MKPELDLLKLLGRDALAIPEANRFNYRQRVVITGAGGSIGSALVKKLVGKVDFLGLMGHSEAPIFELKQKYGYSDTLDYEVRDAGFHPWDWIGRWQPDLIIHTAAHKHVGLMESQPWEAFRNNTESTGRIASAALRLGVKQLTFMSTDKAVKPTSVMGASKRMAEAWLLTHSAQISSVCRCGNVAGSSGSLIELVKEQILKGEEVTLRGEKMSRYFVTPDEVATFVLAASVAPGLYTLNMGAPRYIKDIITGIAEQLGRPDYPIQISEPGSGEKNDEDLFNPNEHHFKPSSTALTRIDPKLDVCAVDEAFADFYGCNKSILEAANSI